MFYGFYFPVTSDEQHWEKQHDSLRFRSHLRKFSGTNGAADSVHQQRVAVAGSAKLSDAHLIVLVMWRFPKIGVATNLFSWDVPF